MNTEQKNIIKTGNMKTLVPLTLTLLGLFIGMSGWTQPSETNFMLGSPLHSSQYLKFTDTVALETNSGEEVLLVMPDLRNINKIDNPDSVLKKMESDYKEILSHLKGDDPVTIHYTIATNGSRASRIDSRKNRGILLLFSNQNTQKADIDHDSLIVTYHHQYQLIFQLNSKKRPENLSGYGLTPIVKELYSALENERSAYRRVKYRIMFGKGASDRRHITTKVDGNDAIEIVAGWGLGYIRDRFVPEMSLRAGTMFSDRYGTPRNYIGVQANLNYIFSDKPEGGINTDINTFLSLEVAHNLASEKGNVRWGSFRVGYLINRQGDFFDENTMRFSWTIVGKSRVTVVPELYAVNNFGSFYPSIRFGYAI